MINIIAIKNSSVRVPLDRIVSTETNDILTSAISNSNVTSYAWDLSGTVALKVLSNSPQQNNGTGLWYIDITAGENDKDIIYGCVSGSNIYISPFVVQNR